MNVETLESRQLLSAPAAPSGLLAYAYMPSSIELSWSDNSNDETGFVIEGATDPSFTYDLITTNVGANATWGELYSGIIGGATYYLRVRAVNGDGNSGNSNVATATPMVFGPVSDTPTGLSAIGVTSSQINVSWNDVVEGFYGYPPNDSGYVLERATDAAFTADYARYTPGQDSGGYAVTGLNPNTAYYFRVRAVSMEGWSDVSTTVSATTLAGDGQAPTVAMAASASPATVATTTTTLSVLGADDGGEGNLTYTWAMLGTPPAGVTFSANGSNAAKSTTATFTKAGSYSFRVTIRDAGNYAVTSDVTVQVNQTLTSIAISPTTVEVQNANAQQFTATAKDQFGLALATQPAFTWSIDAGGVGTINGSGLYTAPASGTGSASVRAVSGALSASSGVSIVAAMAPAGPTGLSAMPMGYDTVGLSWIDNASNETGYLIEQATDAGFSYDLVTTNLPANSNSHTAYGLLANVPYFFRVRAVNGALASANSNTAGVTTEWIPPLPDAPMGLSAAVVSANQINLSWTDVGMNMFGESETGYLLERATDAGFTANFIRFTRPADSTSYSDTSVSGNTTYYYRLRATGMWGWSGVSNTATAATSASGPGVATAASASPEIVTGNSTSLSVLGSSPAGESTLTYIWSAAGPAAVTFGGNGTNAAKNTAVTFAKAGTYNFLVTIRDAESFTATSAVSVQVNQTLTSITVSPSSVSVQDGESQQFEAVARDQFGDALISPPGMVWSVDAGGLGTISSGGLYSAPISGTGQATVRATAGMVSGAAGVYVVAADHPVAGADTALVYQQGVTIELDVLANDVAPAGRMAQVATVTQGGHGGTAIVNGKVAYTPAMDFTGTDTFAYTIVDDQGSISGAQITVTIMPGSEPVIGMDEVAGTPRYTLSNGYVVDAEMDFVSQGMGNYSYTVSAPVSVSVIETDEGENENSVMTAGTRTLTVTSTSGADGSWTYSEVFTHSGTVTTSPVIVGYGSTATETILEMYSFIASGDETTVTYTFTASGGDSVSGSMAGDTTGTWDSSTTSTTTISRSGAPGGGGGGGSGSTDQGGSYSFGSTMTDPYSYATSGGAVNGTITTVANGWGSWHYFPDGTGTGSMDASVTVTYHGMGGYSYDAGGGTVSGTITENGSHGWTVGSAWGETLTNGTWTLAWGSGSSGGTDEDHYMYNGSGGYSSANDSGTINESGNSDSTSGYSIDLFVADGAWQYGGSGFGISSGGEHWSFEGEGTYSYATSGGSVDGTTSSNGSEDSTWNYTWDLLLPTGGEWAMTMGSGTSTFGMSRHSSSIGHGGFNDGSTSGTIDESGTSDSSAGLTVESSVSGGQWTDSGSGNWSTSGSGAWSSTGTGEYAYPTPGGSVSGTSHVNQDSNWSSSYSGHLVLGTDGVWSQDTGEGTEFTYRADDWDYSGSGDYGNSSYGGYITENGEGGSSGTYNMDAAWTGSAWARSGTAAMDGYNGGSWSAAGEGSYTASTLGGSLAGTMTDDSEVHWSTDYSSTNATADGVTWVPVSGNGRYSGGSSGGYEYSGEGTYVTESSSGTITEDGNYRELTSYDVGYIVNGGRWVASGTSQGTFDGEWNQGYSGNGTYERAFGDGTVSGTTTESGSRENDYHVQFDGMMTNWLWTFSGGGSESSRVSDTFTYSGSGEVITLVDSSETQTSGMGPYGPFSSNSSSTHTQHSTLDENGAKTETTRDMTTWVLNPDGSWRTASTEHQWTKSDSGDYDYEFSDVTQSTITVSDYICEGGLKTYEASSEHTVTDKANEQWGYNFDWTDTTTYLADGTTVLEQDRTGGGTSSGQTSHTDDSLDTYDEWYGSTPGFHLNDRIVDGWSQEYTFTASGDGTTGEGTASGGTRFQHYSDGVMNFEETTEDCAETTSPGFAFVYRVAAPLSDLDGTFEGEGAFSTLNATAPEGGGEEDEGGGFWDWTQGILDVAGTFDPTPACDGVNAIISGARGRWTDAALSAVSMVPYGGDLIGKGGKIAKKAMKAGGDSGAISKTVRRVTNSKHHINSLSPEPKNVQELFEKAIADKNGTRWVKDADGTIHRFSPPSNGETHWNGSTSGRDPIQFRNIPPEIKKQLGITE